VRWLGALRDEIRIRDVAKELQSSFRAQEGQFVFRVVLFTHKRKSELSVQQIRFVGIAEFFVRVKTPCWRESGYGWRSPHSQWHPLIRELWDIGNSKTNGDDQMKIQEMLHRLQRAREEYDAEVRKQRGFKIFCVNVLPQY
jgi:hypothetical protein